MAAGRDPLTGDGAGRLVAEWVDAWAPVILEALTAPQAVETLVLDSTDFSWHNRRTDKQRREFAVLLAYGYLPDGRRRLLGAASAIAQSADYLQLLADLLPSPPVPVVADNSWRSRPLSARCGQPRQDPHR